MGKGTGSSADTKNKWVLADMLTFVDRAESKRQ